MHLRPPPKEHTSTAVLFTTSISTQRFLSLQTAACQNVCQFRFVLQQTSPHQHVMNLYGSVRRQSDRTFGRGGLRSAADNRYRKLRQLRRMVSVKVACSMSRALSRRQLNPLADGEKSRLWRDLSAVNAPIKSKTIDGLLFHVHLLHSTCALYRNLSCASDSVPPHSFRFHRQD